MPFRTLAADEADMTNLVEAFDAAWIELDRSTPIAPPYRSAAQNRLGEIIVAMWRADPGAPIVERAVAEFNAQSSVPPPGPQVL
ncbi:MAG: hypothetical protein QHC89_08100 [Bosea sp. (in: a-proteobacteria)]|nr:hypothetical protein [Bosea sp. (in: a-proteobacteria)]